MNATPKSKLWLICPVCGKANPPERKFCMHCWGATLRPDISVTTQELAEIAKRRQAYLKRQKMIKITRATLVPLITLGFIAFLSLYFFTDVLFKPPQEVNSTSRFGEWAMFRHDLARSGTTDSTSLLPQGTVKWVFPTGSGIHSSPAVANGTVYFGSRDGKVYALDADTGVKRWEYQTGSWVDSSPAIVNGVVYIGSNDGKLYALDARSGEKLWDFKTTYPIVSSPAITNGIVYFGAEDYYFYALDATTGTKLWNFNTTNPVISSPVVANGIVYVGSGSEYFYTLHALSGRLRLRFKPYYSVASSPAVIKNTVYFITTNGYLYAVDANARTWPNEHNIKPYWIQIYAFGLPGIPLPPPQSGFLWARRLGTTANSSPTVINDTLYVGVDNKLMAVDTKSRQKQWEFKTEGKVRSSPAVVDNTVYIGSEDGRFYAIDATSGRKLWDIPTGDKITSAPAIANGTIYFGSQNGKLYAIK